MEENLSFPGLGLDFNIDRVAFNLPEFLGGAPIYWYGILIATGFLLAVIYIMRRAKVYGLDSDRAFDVTFLTIILGIIGARLYFVAFSWDGYKGDLLAILNFRGGGLAIYGGIIFGILGVILGCKLRNVKLLPMLDLTAGGVLIGQAIGRWGNFTNIEAFGNNTSLPWGMTSPAIQSYLSQNQKALEEIGMWVNPSQPVHPTFLYESLWCILGFALILFLTKKRRFDGQITLVYLGWYGIGRFFIEGLRTDSLMVGDMRISKTVGLICFIAAALLLIFIFMKIKKANDPEYLKLYVNTEEAELIRRGEFYKNKSKKSADSTKALGDLPEQDKLAEDISKDVSDATPSEKKENLSLEDTESTVKSAEDEADEAKDITEETKNNA